MSRTFRALLGVVALLIHVSCVDERPLQVGASPSTPTVISPFDGELRCATGDELGAGVWDYGANPRGTIEDPVHWVSSKSVGLRPELTLSFVERVGDREDVVVISEEDGRTLGFVDFARDEDGLYFPVTTESCASSGLHDFVE